MEVKMYTTIWTTFVATELHTDWNVLRKCFDEAVRMLVAPTSARMMLVCLYQEGALVSEMY